jgi:hypothetical protein
VILCSRALAPACALVLLVSRARASDPYADFRVPAHRSLSWRVSGFGSWNGNDGNNGGRTRNGNLVGSLNTASFWLSESESRLQSLVVSGGSTGSRNHFTSERSDRFSSVIDRERSDTRQHTDAFSVDAAQRAFLHDTPVSWDVDVALNLSADELHHSFSDVELFGTSEEDDKRRDLDRQRSAEVVGTFGIGIGHPRDVTGVYSAQVIEQRLAAAGRLVHPLSPEALQKLALLHYVAGDFAVAHDRPDRYFWREAERILRDDGAVDGPLDAWSVLRIREPSVVRSPFPRVRGSLARPFAFGRQENGHTLDTRDEVRTLTSGGTVQFSDSIRFRERDGIAEKSTGAGLDLECHRPFGMRWQADVAVTNRYDISGRREWDVVSAANLHYFIADRWTASAHFNQDATTARAGDGRTPPAWSLFASSELGYLLEDSWTVALSLSHFQEHRMLSRFSLAPDFQRASRLALSFTWRPVGWFDVPGLGIRQHGTTPPL